MYSKQQMQKQAAGSSETIPGKGISSPAVPALQQKSGEEEELLQSKSTAQRIEIPEEYSLQGRFIPAQLKNEVQATPKQQPFQLKTNNTGMPDTLKSGLENISGFDLSDVKVHYNSAQPAQLNALAYAQGNNIHVGPGQEKHLPHEGWHVVQQRQGRVRPTVQMKQGIPVNDDPGLEKEADVMGAQAMQHKNFGTDHMQTEPVRLPPAQLYRGMHADVLQARWVDAEGREGYLFYDNLEETEGIRWYYRESKKRGGLMSFRVSEDNPHAELLRDQQNIEATREEWEEAWTKINWARNPVTVEVKMGDIATVNDSFSTLHTGGFAGCMGLVFIQGSKRTLTHIYSGDISDPSRWMNLWEVKSKAATANRTYIINALGEWRQGDGNGGDNFIRNFGLQGNITFLPGHMGSATVDPQGRIT